MHWSFSNIRPFQFEQGYVALALFFAVGPLSAQQDLRFEDVSSFLVDGPSHTSHVSFGAGAWGDFNGDKFPDLFCGNHARPSALFLNRDGDEFRSILNLISSVSDFDDIH